MPDPANAWTTPAQSKTNLRNIPKDFFLPGIQAPYIKDYAKLAEPPKMYGASPTPGNPFANLAGGDYSGLLEGGGGGSAGGGWGGSANATPPQGQAKIGGAISGATTGWSVGGPWGALVGAIAGYGLNGGFKDSTNISGTGLTGLTMDEAWKDGNLTRIMSNPLGGLASKLGVKSDSVLGKALDPAGMFGSKQSVAEGTWDTYKKAPGAVPGSAFSEKAFAEVVKGAFDSNRSVFPEGGLQREKFLSQYAGAISQAARKGTITPEMTANQIYKKVGLPWLMDNVSSSAEFKKNKMLAPLFKDVTERYLSNLPITRGNMDAFAGNSDYKDAAFAPLFFDSLARKKPPASPHPQIPTPVKPGIGTQQVIARGRIVG